MLVEESVGELRSEAKRKLIDKQVGSRPGFRVATWRSLATSRLVPNKARTRKREIAQNAFPQALYVKRPRANALNYTMKGRPRVTYCSSHNPQKDSSESVVGEALFRQRRCCDVNAGVDRLRSHSNLPFRVNPILDYPKGLANIPERSTPSTTAFSQFTTEIRPPSAYAVMTLGVRL